jgi:hypothetical protein
MIVATAAQVATGMPRPIVMVVMFTPLLATTCVVSCSFPSLPCPSRQLYA